MVKYKELPAFESIEEFKVGDRVRFYSAYKNRVGKITEIRPEEGLLIILCGCDTVVSPHFKTCRKLEPIEPRTITLCVECMDGEIKNPLWTAGYCGDNMHTKVLYQEVLDG